MLHRVSKQNDVNKDKWIGVGGKVEPFESIDECMKREVLEETGLHVEAYRYAGSVTFINDEYYEYMHVFTVSKFSGTLTTCDEGTLEFVKKAEVLNLPMWEGDKIFLKPLLKNKKFRCSLYYNDEKLINYKIK